MKTRFVMISVVVLVSHICFSQDVILYKNGTEERCKVIEVTPSQVKYKKEDNPDGPVYTTYKSAIQIIRYANGNEDVFSIPKTSTVAPIVSTPVVEKKEEDIFYEPLKFSGPRIGFTIVGKGEAADKIRERGKTPFVMQFGWQFETRVFTMKSGATALIEFIPLIAGIEQGMFLPSFNGMFGIRGKKGNEFAIGPNLSLTGAGLALAVGTSFHTENIYFPINFAVVPSVSRRSSEYNSNTGTTRDVSVHTGVRVSFLVGFNTRKR